MNTFKGYVRCVSTESSGYVRRSEIINGKFAEPIMLRQDDELKDLAASINMLLQYFWLKGGPKGEAE